MNARILVVDDEPEFEVLVVQKFCWWIRDGSVTFLFARDGIEAFSIVPADGGVDMVVSDIKLTCRFL